MTEIKGTIDYTISKNESGNWELSYNQNLENDLASIALCQSVVTAIKEDFVKRKSDSAGKVKKAYSDMIGKLSTTQMGLNKSFTFMISNYEAWQKHKAALAAHKEANPPQTL